MKHQPARHPPNGPTNIWWPWLKRFVTAIFFLLVAWLLVMQARSVDWSGVLTSMAGYPLPLVLIAIALTVISLLLYSSFDLLGRHYAGHTLRSRTVMWVNFISYMFSLNLGAMVGSVALRYRLYAQQGLDTGTITRVISLSMLSNWIGYLLVGGVIFGFYPMALPPGWIIDRAGLQLLGFGLLTLALFYLLLCALSRQRCFTIRGYEICLPSLQLAVLQLGMGAANWLLMGAVVFQLLQQKIGFPAVAGVLLVSAIAGAVAHIPAGLGVMEAVFVALLSHQLPKSELLAALLAYRGIYYLAPLVLAVVLYLVAETRARRSVPPIRPSNAALDRVKTKRQPR
jgi:uncharacterized membrane protein YbhN (UPF0104 family)